MVRQRSAKPLFTGSNPVAASICPDKFAGFLKPANFFLYVDRFSAILPFFKPVPEVFVLGVRYCLRLDFVYLYETI